MYLQEVSLSKVKTLHRLADDFDIVIAATPTVQNAFHERITAISHPIAFEVVGTIPFLVLQVPIRLTTRSLR